MSEPKAVLTVNETGTRFVTPDDPLIINETSVTFDDVVIQGGEIIAQVETHTTFKNLTKES